MFALVLLPTLRFLGIPGRLFLERLVMIHSTIAEWIFCFGNPCTAYELRATGLHQVKALRDLGVDCIVRAVSKVQNPLVINMGVMINEKAL